jgi:hypothetical protein
MAYAGRGQIVEHRSSPAGRWLKERRLRLAAWIAVAEGILVLLHVIPKLAAILIAISVILAYFTAGRNLRQSVLREGALVAMGSQAFVLLVPVLFIIFTWLAILALVVLAAVAVAVLLARR